MKRNILFILANLLLSNLFAQMPNTDLWLLDVKTESDSIYLDNPKNISNRDGYDNQPVFFADGKSLIYTSMQDGKQTDIYSYDLSSGKSKQLTNTPTSEYSPQFAPDGQNISVVMVEADSTQRLWKFPKTGGAATLMMDKVDSVGYYCWIDFYSVGVFKLGKPNKLYRCDVSSQTCTYVADSVGRTLFNISFPGKLKKLFYSRGKNIYSDDTRNKVIETTRIGTGEDFCFYKSNQVLMADGAKIYSRIYVTIGRDDPWKEMIDLSSSGISKITRIAVSPDRSKVVIVAE